MDLFRISLRKGRIGMLETIQAFFKSLMDYFANFDWNEAIESLKMLVKNFDFQLIKDTINTLIEFIKGLIG